ncbi:MAG: large conductance mechanosensitive channel protein MscL [Candidatus Aenigmatarchaeota archaeon]
MGLLKEFMDFLKEYKVLPLAIAFIMGIAITALIQSLVNDIIMPVITLLLPGEDWKAATFTIGPVVLKWGSFLSAVINFVIIAFVVFLIAKFALRKEKVEKV